MSTRALNHLAAACAAYPDTVVAVTLPAVGARLNAIALEQAAAATGGSGRLSRYNSGAGVTLDAATATVGRSTVRLTPRPLGPWTLVESGSHKSSWMEPRGATPGRQHGHRRIRLANGGVRWYARHGPVAGKQAWTKTKAAVDEELPDLFHRSVLTAWDKVS